jgi:hypothetical protein
MIEIIQKREEALYLFLTLSSRFYLNANRDR